MTRLLISVRNVQEAEDALAGGADVIDVKEPRHGPLGAAPAEVVRSVIESVSGRAPVSAALGELAQNVDRTEWGRLPLSFAKIGLARCTELPDWRRALSSAWEDLPAEIARVAVAYADWQRCQSVSPEEVVEAAADIGSRVLLVDTYSKQQRLLDFVTLGSIKSWAVLAERRGLRFVLAGSLRRSQLATIVPECCPHYVAVRGAACEGNRESSVSRELVRGLRQELTRLRLPPVEEHSSADLL